MDLHIHGIPIRAGDRAVTLLGAANRDPRTFPDPNHFDLGRDGAPPLSFGTGIHHCLGAALARTEGHIVFGRPLDRFPLIEPAWADNNRPRHRNAFVLRGLQSLPVHL